MEPQNMGFDRTETRSRERKLDARHPLPFFAPRETKSLALSRPHLTCGRTFFFPFKSPTYPRANETLTLSPRSSYAAAAQ
jgi:hypothetical protein